MSDKPEKKTKDETTDKPAKKPATPTPSNHLYGPSNADLNPAYAPPSE